MTTHYLDCRLTVQREDYNFMFARLYRVAHSIIGRQPEANIGLSFPKYDNGRLGYIMRFFASETILNSVRSNEGLSVLQDCRIIKLANIEKTPDLCPHVCFFRYRAIEQLTPTYQKKRSKRFTTHLQKMGITQVNEADSVQRFEQFKANIHQQQQYIKFTSSSNGCDYSLSIYQSDFIEARVGRYNSFGLSDRENCVTVPQF